MNISFYSSLLYNGNTAEMFSKYYYYLLKFSGKFNLTSILDREECYKKHFLDSILAEKYIYYNSYCCDLGSGAGFPGIPLMIVRDDLRFVLLESSKKKCEFLNFLIQEFHLNANVINSRAETVGRIPEQRESFDFVVSRAVSSLPVVLEYSSPLVKVGGHVISYKGKCSEELVLSQYAMSELHLSLLDKIEYSLCASSDYRTLLIFKKDFLLSPKYPRRDGAPAHKPLLKR